MATKFVKIARHVRTRLADEPKEVFYLCGDYCGHKPARRIMVRRFLHNALIGKK